MKKSTGKPKVSVVYDHKKIESKWQKVWDKKKPNRATEDMDKKKFFGLIEFPYPSGDGLHVGHIRSNTAMDIIVRKRRREGYEVLYPIGWDAFGLPTENYAIKTGIQPAIVTKRNTDIFRRQLKALGFSFDWSREIDTTDPKYYRWTQWIFLQFLKKGLAYKKKMTINWCPKDLIGLANEEVINGACERCGTQVEKREKEQWMLAITKYAERLDKDLDDTQFLEKIKIQQRNWIGKSEGAEIKFKVNSVMAGQAKSEITVFTTRPDTLFGVTYVVLAPEHSLVSELLDQESAIQNQVDVRAYISASKKKAETDRTDASKQKTGVELKGIKAINPATKEEIPVWIADYVLADYGTGAVMAVPAHDERDYAFAQKYGLPVKEVIEPLIIEKDAVDAVRPELPFKERNAVVAIIKHWSEDKYLGLRWKKNGWQGFVVGGIENGENAQTAGLREIKEETGYQNIEYVRDLGGIVHSQFYHMVKQENRFGHFKPMVFQLKNGEHVEISDEEKALHEIVWLTPEEFDRFVNKDDLRIMWGRMRGIDCYTGDGLLTNSGTFTGKRSDDSKKAITESVGGRWVTTFKLRDWIFSRQRYWGEPIPVVHCGKCGIVPVPEKDLPVKLPKVKNYAPTQTGESPLAAISKWVNTKCPTCKGKAKRETDTMPNWAGSSWYYLRYADPKNTKAFASKKALDYWTPVDWYNGGMEHTTLHLLYSRFWHKFLYDLGLVPTSEPYVKRTSHGLILAANGEKMSKSRGNVVNPDSIVETVGADSLRLYEMFMGPFDQPIAWNTDNIAGVRRFIERVWKLREKVVPSEFSSGRGLSERRVSGASSAGPEETADSATFKDSLGKILHKTIKKVSEDIEAMRFNTAISSLMIALNELEKSPEISRGDYEVLIQLIAPFAPHVTEELWASLGNKTSVHMTPWPTYDPALTVDSDVKMVVQVNGKVRASLEVASNTPREEVERLAKDLPEIKKWIGDSVIKKVIVVPNKLVNFVI